MTGYEAPMHTVYRYAFPVLWLGWALYWWVASRNVKANVRHESPASRLAHIVPLMVALYLFWGPRPRNSFLAERFLPAADWPFWLGLLMAVGGILVSVWARLTLGRNWSGTVTIKQDHELVTGGPYAIVRHPIYTGLLLAFIGSALARGEWRGILAVALVFVAFERKRRHEERWMREQFGAAYDAYAGRVAALIPYLH